MRANHHRAGVLALGIVFVLLGCNPEGTCLVENDPKQDRYIGDECNVNTNKKACETTRSSTFVDKSKEDGWDYCTGEGYRPFYEDGASKDDKKEERREAKKRAKAGELVMLYKSR